MIEVKEKQFSNADFLPEVVKLINEGHSVTLLLRGYSMRPFLENNRDKAILVKAKQLRKGMPVLAEISKGHFVLHRIVAIKANQVVLRGDGNIGTEYCKSSDVKAEAIGFYRKGNKIPDSVDGFKWQIYSFFWTSVLPLKIRRYILAIFRRVWK